MRRVEPCALAAALGLGACSPPVDCAAEPPAAGELTSCAAVEDRPYDVVLPPGQGPHPVLLVLHGGGGRPSGARKVTCKDGDLDDPGCIDKVATAAGMIVVFPSGVKGGLGTRTWNAGGGVGGWQCVSGKACEEGSDDVAYIDAVLADLRRWASVDDTRLYVTGLSNGGAMSYRLACERAEVFAAVAPVGGADQLGAAQGCTPAVPVPLLHTHGTEDPCWAFETSSAACIQDDGTTKVGVEETLTRWRQINGCVGEATVEAVPDTVQDGTSTTRSTWACAADTELLTVTGGGHTWPGGFGYFPEDRIGRVAQDYDLDALLVPWLLQHRREAPGDTGP